jgi:hypothetical protein
MDKKKSPKRKKAKLMKVYDSGSRSPSPDHKPHGGHGSNYSNHSESIHGGRASRGNKKINR